MLAGISANTTMFTRVSLVAAYLASGTVLAGINLSDAILVRAVDVLSTPYSALVSSSSSLSSSPSSLSTSLSNSEQKQKQQQQQSNGPQSFNFTAWDMETSAACLEATRNVQRATNPTGTCICYNLPVLDADAGTFEADIRLYRVSEARGDFATVDPATISVNVVYKGASASPITLEALMAAKAGGGGDDSAAAVAAAAGVAESKASLSSSSLTRSKRAGDGNGDVYFAKSLSGASFDSRLVKRSDPELLQKYLLVGQIDKDRMSKSLSMADLQSIVMPTLTLAATKSSNSKPITAALNINEAAFVNGVFSRERVQSDFSAAQSAVLDALDALHNDTAAFVLPGVQLMIFPIGFVITSVWLVIGVVAYGIGSFERMQHAELFKLRRRESRRPNVGSKPI